MRKPKRTREQTSAAFWSNVDQSEGPAACWPWLRSRLAGGYGRVSFEGKLRLAHRVAAHLSFGVALDDALHDTRQKVLHVCNNPPCCNPKHFEIGTQIRNMKYAAECKRARTKPRFDEANSATKLTPAQVVEIRNRRRNGEFCYVIARDYGISKSHVSDIAHYKYRAHIKGETRYA